MSRVTSLTAAALACVCAVTMTACSSKGDSTESTSSSAAASSASSAPSTSAASSTSSKAAAAGEVTIATKLGDESFPVAPKKVVALGQVAIDNLLSLGVTPDVIVISAREKDIPWQEGKLKDAKVIEIASFKDTKAEEIAATHPDLIVGDQWRVKKDNFETFTSIAPTLGAVGNGGWKDQLLALGKIYDKEDAAKKVIADTAATFAAAAKQMPGLKGKTGVVSQYIGPQRAFGVIADPKIPASEFLQGLNMVIPDSIQKLPDIKAGRATVAAENIDLLSAGFMLIGPRGASAEEMQAVPGYDKLPQVVAGATRVAKNPALLQAVNQPSALSLTYALKELQPELEKAAAEKVVN